MGYFQIKLLLYLCNVFVCFRLFFSLQLCLVYMAEYGTGYYFVANTEIIQDSIFCVFMFIYLLLLEMPVVHKYYVPQILFNYQQVLPADWTVSL